MMPTAAEVLRPGDVLALAGTGEAIDAACELLGADRVAHATNPASPVD